ncbi:MAG: type II secretion system F family protein [Candidatus Omnitrophica bacterium]|nr:type II secretion system F family protein [Candidatus Omnitrophota bacterium]
MTWYIYKAVDSQGKYVKGEMEATSEMALTTELAKKGYLPVSITFKAKTQIKKGVSGAGKKTHGTVDMRTLVIFTRQFATIIKAAVPILEGLGVLAEQAEDLALKKALQEILRDVEAGTSLSQALAKHPGIFSELYVNTVIAGESAGILDKVLMRLAEMLEEDLETRSNISAALRYPIMVVIAMIVAVVVLTVFVMPQFAKIYAQANTQLPLPTQIMILFGHILRHYWYAVIAGIGVFSLLWRVFIKTAFGRNFWDSLKFKIPIFGKLYTKITMLRFASMLNVLYQSGLPILRTLEIVGMTIGNVVLENEVNIIKRAVADGKGISGGILNSKFFPRLVGYMVSVGEKSGQLPLMLDSLCEYFGLEVRTTVKNLTALIEPLMTAVLGVVVMGMALAIFLPLWNMIQLFKK